MIGELQSRINPAVAQVALVLLRAAGTRACAASSVYTSVLCKASAGTDQRSHVMTSRASRYARPLDVHNWQVW